MSFNRSIKEKMKRNQTLYIALFFVLNSFCTTLAAQAGSTTEAEVDLQSMFIAAAQYKILGDYDKAIELYEQVLKKDSKNHATAYEVARVYDVMDKDELALKAIKKAVDLDASNMWYQMFLADVYQKMSQDKKAAQVYKSLVKIYPENEYHYYKLAFFLVRAKETSEAIKVYDQMEKQFGINEEFIRRKHALYAGLGDNKKAVKELQKLINKFPDNTDYYHLLAGFYEQIDDKKAAKATYKKILAINPNDAQAKLATTNKNDDVVYLNTLKPIFSEAEEDIDVKIKALFPYLNKVVAAGASNPTLADATLELADILTQTHPEEAKAYSIQGDLFYHTGQLDKAKSSYQKTIELDNSVFPVWEQLLYLHAEQYDMDALLKTSEAAMDLFPNQAKAYYMNGLANIETQQYNQATSSLEQAALMARRKPELKIDILAKLGVAYSELKKYDRAEKKLQEAIAMNPKNATVLDAYGWMYYKQGKNDMAKEYLDKALANGGDQNATILEHYGDLAAQLGDASKAQQYWKKAQTQGNSSEALRKKIAGTTSPN